MTLYRHHPATPPRFYDGGAWILHFWPDALRIDAFDPRGLKSDPDLSQVHTPSINLRHLGATFWAGAIADAGRGITVTLEGPGTGSIDETWGTGAMADGHFERTIHFARVEAGLEPGHLRLRFAIQAGPVLPKDPPLDLRDEHKRPRQLQFECRVPLEEVPPLLSMNDRQLGHFEPILNAHRRLART